ncbi:MAG TPA: MGMT family protein [Bryobacteraceae bacterium]|nr:MGMT family protein [Bryobacteraceae bacterium]
MKKPVSAKKKVTAREVARKLLRAPKSLSRDQAIRQAVRQIPRGKVATYGQVAAAAGYPLYHRQVVQILNKAGGSLPWQRVVGAGGAIKLRFGAGQEQRMRLQMEGVRFRGKRVDMAEHQHVFRPWEFEDDIP